MLTPDERARLDYLDDAKKTAQRHRGQVFGTFFAVVLADAERRASKIVRPERTSPQD